ncbi:MAG: hypothetical protein NHF89_00095 [Candidatus Shikimatogenerans bostrichidophilus]|nr:MAG: hypothetical protein NHF89_00095 [Candidatus Shikimatogenerans bostrichidophilus]
MNKFFVPFLTINNKLYNTIYYKNNKYKLDYIKIFFLYIKRSANEIFIFDNFNINNKKKVFLNIINRLSYNYNLPISIEIKIKNINYFNKLFFNGVNKIMLDYFFLKNDLFLKKMLKFDNTIIILKILSYSKFINLLNNNKIDFNYINKYSEILLYFKEKKNNIYKIINILKNTINKIKIRKIIFLNIKNIFFLKKIFLKFNINVIINNYFFSLNKKNRKIIFKKINIY